MSDASESHQCRGIGGIDADASEGIKAIRSSTYVQRHRSRRHRLAWPDSAPLFAADIAGAGAFAGGCVATASSVHADHSTQLATAAHPDLRCTHDEHSIAEATPVVAPALEPSPPSLPTP